MTNTAGNTAGIANISVSLLNAQGVEVSKTEAHKGIAEFCDLGFGMHTIVVGRIGECGVVRLENIRVWQQVPQVLRVVMNTCGQDVTASGCIAYFRVSSASEKISQATVQAEDGAYDWRTDKYGRIWLGVARGGTASYSFTAKGFRRRTVTLKCDELKVIEMHVVLERE